jgi:hypothetical protein
MAIMLSVMDSPAMALCPTGAGLAFLGVEFGVTMLKATAAGK